MKIWTDGKMNVEHCRIENQIVDIMTKGVQIEVFRRLRVMMNVDSLDIMNCVEAGFSTEARKCLIT